MKDSENQLNKSLQQYQELLDGITSVSKTISNIDGVSLEKSVSWFNNSMDEIRSTDAAINELFNQDKSLTLSPLFQERFRLMELAQEAVDGLIPNIAASLAMHKSEMKNLRQGRQLTGGYASKQDRTGRLISCRR